MKIANVILLFAIFAVGDHVESKLTRGSMRRRHLDGSSKGSSSMSSSSSTSSSMSSSGKGSSSSMSSSSMSSSSSGKGSGKGSSSSMSSSSSSSKGSGKGYSSDSTRSNRAYRNWDEVNTQVRNADPDGWQTFAWGDEDNSWVAEGWAGGGGVWDGGVRE